MPFTTRAGARIYWRSDGHPDAPPLMLGNSLGTDFALWDPIMPALTQSFRVVRMDTRGHGASDAPAGDYTIEMLGRDVLAVADAARLDRFSWAGVSLGGMIGMWLGANSSERVARLVLSNTGAKLDPSGWADRIAKIRAGGMAAIADTVMGRFFTASFVANPNAHCATVRETLLSLDPVGYIGCCAAIRDMDLSSALARIVAPTLVVVGEHDLATPRPLGEAIAAAVPGARLLVLPVAHLPHSERPEQFVAEVVPFLRRAVN